MKLKHVFLAVLTLVTTNSLYAQDKDLRKASDLGEVMTVDNEVDDLYFGNWEVIGSESDSANINLMPKEDGPQGQYLFLKPTNERSAVSSYIDDQNYHSVDLGFYVYRKDNMFYANLEKSVAVVFEMEHKGQLIEFKCEYLKDKDQLKLTTSDDVVFYLKRMY